MKLKVFQSDHGDCCLLTSGTGAKKKHIFVDGGLERSYTEHVAPYMGRLRKQGTELDLVCVSHIDQDHIAGMLRMLNDEMAWRVYDYQRNDVGNASFPKPDSPRPPKVKEIWHNSFHDQLEDNAGPVGDLLAANAAILSGADDPELLDISVESDTIATSIPEALRLSRRISSDQLGIPLNSHWKGKLAMVKSKSPITIGDMSIYLVGPFEDDVKNLRDDWNKWLRENKARVRTLRQEAESDVDSIGSSTGERALLPMLEQAKRIGNRDQVTPPNLASVMFLVEEGNSSILFTGDGHADEVIKGLRHHGKLNNGPMMIDIMKVPHHGSEHNWTDELGTNVLAKHYVFCGNGFSTNPELIVIEKLVNARANDGRKYKLWFNSSSKLPPNAKYRAHMASVEKTVKRLATKSGGQMTYEFMSEGTFDITF